MKRRNYLIKATLFIAISVVNFAYASEDWQEGGSTIGCAWAKDIPGAKAIAGKAAPTVTLNFYSDSKGKALIKSITDDRNFYFAVAKHGQFAKLKLNDAAVGWVSVKQLEFGALRNCNLN